MAGMTVQWFMDRAAERIGDPLRSRVTAAELLSFVNLSLSDICTKFDLFEVEDDFEVPAGKELSYPDDCTRVIEIAVSATPSDPDSFIPLGEKLSDEYRRDTGTGTYPTSDVPHSYFADQGTIRIWPKAMVAIPNGGIIKYYGVPEMFSDTSLVVPIPNFLKSYLLERIVIYALEADDRDAQAHPREQKWSAREDEIRELIEDRSIDRRTSFRPESQRRGLEGSA